MFTSSIKRENRHFPVVVVQWRERNVHKSVMHEQSCCFAYSPYWLFKNCRCPRCCDILKSLLWTSPSPPPIVILRIMIIYCCFCYSCLFSRCYWRTGSTVGSSRCWCCNWGQQCSFSGYHSRRGSYCFVIWSCWSWINWYVVYRSSDIHSSVFSSALLPPSVSSFIPFFLLFTLLASHPSDDLTSALASFLHFFRIVNRLNQNQG